MRGTLPLLRSVWSAVLLLPLLATPSFGQKTDVVTLRNGDSITGEIKRLKRGKLEYSTDDMGTIYIEWDKVVRLTSRWFFEVELASHRILFGNLPASADTGVIVVALTSIDTVDVQSVVTITPIKQTFFSRVYARIDFGFDVTRANNQTEYSLAVLTRYRGRRYSGEINLDSYLRNQDGGGTTRNKLQLTTSRMLSGAWSSGLLGLLEQNQELDLDLRTQLGVTAILNLLHSHRASLYASSGVLVGGEKFTGEESLQSSVELAVSSTVEAFRYDTPKLDLSATLAAFPSLSDIGRVRVNFNTRFSYEFIKDLTVGLRGFVYYDSRPPSEAAASTDYSLSFTFGWKYN